MEFACAIVSLAGRVEVRRVERRPIVLAGSGAKPFFSPPSPSLSFSFFFEIFNTIFVWFIFLFFFFFIIYERSNVFCGVKSIDRFYDSFIFGEAVFYSFLSFFFSLPFPSLDYRDVPDVCVRFFCELCEVFCR